MSVRQGVTTTIRPIPASYPFTAIVGQEEMKLGLILSVIDPHIEGVLIMGHRGTGKSTAVRALADVLPWNNGDGRAASDIKRLNALLAEIADGLGVPLLRFHDTLVDGTQPQRMRLECTDDGDHPSVEGHRLLGERAFRLPG